MAIIYSHSYSHYVSPPIVFFKGNPESCNEPVCVHLLGVSQSYLLRIPGSLLTEKLNREDYFVELWSNKLFIAHLLISKSTPLMYFVYSLFAHGLTASQSWFSAFLSFTHLVKILSSWSDVTRDPFLSCHTINSSRHSLSKIGEPPFFGFACMILSGTNCVLTRKVPQAPVQLSDKSQNKISDEKKKKLSMYRCRCPLSITLFSIFLFFLFIYLPTTRFDLDGGVILDTRQEKCFYV